MLAYIDIDLSNNINEYFDPELDTAFIDINIELDWDSIAEEVLDLYTGGYDIDEIVHRIKQNESKYVTASHKL
jgi:hypothetical protein